ncbi:MAG TPA: HAMP domain-containing sensor histidine kinase [Kofleriaceae bacterium]|nr:HAMP domain-containing sensor histidine kinase [Kofleriaceae bacterium]
MRLDTFLTDHRSAIIERCRTKVLARRPARPTDGELDRGIPRFLEQLIETLRRDLARNSDPDGVAKRYGGALMTEGFTIAQVVHDYGDVCQSVTDLAVALDAPISTEDFRTLNRCLDEAIADAVTEFARLHDLGVADESNQRLGVFAHEARNLINAATLSFDVLKTGRIGMAGSTGAVLERSLTRLTTLIARSLAEVRLETGNVHHERVEVSRLLEEIEISASVSAKQKGVTFSVLLPNQAALAVTGDPQILAAIVVNLVQNAIKFTTPPGHVVLGADATDATVRIYVSDQCGGLPAGVADSLAQPFRQHSRDRSGLGLGLFIARRGALAHNGEIRVHDLPGAGCIFSLELPRAT